MKYEKVLVKLIMETSKFCNRRFDRACLYLLIAIFIYKIDSVFDFILKINGIN